MTQFLHVFDTESASLEGGVVEIALTVLDDNLDVVFETESLIDPERPISPTAMGIHHITDKMVWGKPTLAEWSEITRYPFMSDNLILCGHNVAFDIRMCRSILPEQFTALCTLKLARALWPNAPDHKLQTLRYMLGLDAGDAHRAMGDVKACVSMLRRIRDDAGLTLADMLNIVSQPMSLDTLMPFGKHKGTPLRELPRNYVSWALSPNGLTSCDPDLRAALERLS